MERQERFWKLFRLLGSDNESEALAALRSIKALLSSSGTGWNQWSAQLEEKDRAMGAMMGATTLGEFMEIMRKELKLR